MTIRLRFQRAGIKVRCLGWRFARASTVVVLLMVGAGCSDGSDVSEAVPEHLAPYVGLWQVTHLRDGDETFPMDVGRPWLVLRGDQAYVEVFPSPQDVPLTPSEVCELLPTDELWLLVESGTVLRTTGLMEDRPVAIVNEQTLELSVGGGIQTLIYTKVGVCEVPRRDSHSLSPTEKRLVGVWGIPIQDDGDVTASFLWILHTDHSAMVWFTSDELPITAQDACRMLALATWDFDDGTSVLNIDADGFAVGGGTLSSVDEEELVVVNPEYNEGVQTLARFGDCSD
jgi:hypothetical protein